MCHTPVAASHEEDGFSILPGWGYSSSGEAKRLQVQQLLFSRCGRLGRISIVYVRSHAGKRRRLLAKKKEDGSFRTERLFAASFCFIYFIIFRRLYG